MSSHVKAIVTRFLLNAAAYDEFSNEYDIKKKRMNLLPEFLKRTYRLIEVEDKEMGRRYISTGQSPLDLGIVAMA